MRNLERLGNRISVPIQPDEEGYIGRECPVETCVGYFKITPGTGLKGPAPCHCPYCGHSGEQNARPQTPADDSWLTPSIRSSDSGGESQASKKALVQRTDRLQWTCAGTRRRNDAHRLRKSPR